MFFLATNSKGPNSTVSPTAMQMAPPVQNNNITTEDVDMEVDSDKVKENKKWSMLHWRWFCSVPIGILWGNEKAGRKAQKSTW